MAFTVIDKNKLEDLDTIIYEKNRLQIEAFFSDVLDGNDLGDFLKVNSDEKYSLLIQWIRVFDSKISPFKYALNINEFFLFLVRSNIQYFLKEAKFFSPYRSRNILIEYDCSFGEFLRTRLYDNKASESHQFYSRFPAYLEFLTIYLPIFEDLDKVAKTKHYYLPVLKEEIDNIFEGYLSTQNLISSTFIQAMRKIADDEKADKKLTPEDEFALYFIASLACLDPDSAFSKTYSENISKDAKDQKSILALTISKYSRAIVNKLSKTYLIQYQDRSISLQDLIFAENYDGFSNMLIQIKEIRARYDFFEYAKRRLFNYYMKTKDFDNAGMLLESLDSYKSFNISPDNLMLEINSEIGLYTYDLYRPVTIFDLFNFQNKQTASEFLERIMPLFDELTSHLVDMAEFFLLTKRESDFDKIFTLLISQFPINPEIEGLKAKKIYFDLQLKFHNQISSLEGLDEIEKIDALIKEIHVFNREFYLERLKSEYQINLAKLDKFSINCIITGDYVFDTLKKNLHRMDYASAAVSWCRAAEKEVIEKLIRPILKSKNPEIKKLLEEIKGKPTLGTLSKITEVYYDSVNFEGRRARTIFRNLLTRSFTFSEDDFISLCQKIDKLRHDYRNLVSHPESITLVLAEECRGLIVGVKQILHIISNNYNA